VPAMVYATILAVAKGASVLRAEIGPATFVAALAMFGA
jgi:hypothetical protein